MNRSARLSWVGTFIGLISPHSLCSFKKYCRMAKNFDADGFFSEFTIWINAWLSICKSYGKANGDEAPSANVCTHPQARPHERNATQPRAHKPAPAHAHAHAHSHTPRPTPTPTPTPPLTLSQDQALEAQLSKAGMVKCATCQAYFDNEHGINNHV